MKSILKLICLNLICACGAFSQNVAKSPIHKAELFFNASIKEQSRLFKGPLVQPYNSDVKGSANFQDLTSFTTGSVNYEGFQFDSIPLIYNIHLDKVITTTDNGYSYSLHTDRVKDFNLNGHTFKYLSVIDSTKSVIRAGFYDLLHNGKFKIYAKRTKSMQFTLEDRRVKYFFVPRTLYYIERDQEYTPVNSEKSFLNYFSDKKPILKKKLREQRIKFRKTPEEAMLFLASYYESLTN